MCWFDFLGWKAQHGDTPVDKKVFCDELLGLAEYFIALRSGMFPRPPGRLCHEGVLVPTHSVRVLTLT
jgi:hypothetical protein